MKKLALFTAAVMLLAIVGCSKESNKNEKESTTTKNSQKTIAFILSGTTLETADVSTNESNLVVFKDDKITLNKGDKVKIKVGNNTKNGLIGVNISGYDLTVKEGEEKTITLDKKGEFKINGLNQVQCITTPCDPINVEKGTLVVK